MVDPRLLADLAHAEGCRLTAYRDGLGFWTIGYGHLLDQSIDWTGHVITKETAVALLAQDTAERIAQAQKLPEWPSLDTDCRRNAVVECIFNLGVDHWTRQFPKTRQFIQAGQWDLAASALRASPLWVSQVGSARVNRLARYLQDGDYTALTAATGS